MVQLYFLEILKTFRSLQRPKFTVISTKGGTKQGVTVQYL